MQLEGILTREQEEAGLTVTEDEDLVCLRFLGRILATWHSLGVRPAGIQIEAQLYLSQLRMNEQAVPDRSNDRG